MDINSLVLIFLGAGGGGVFRYFIAQIAPSLLIGSNLFPIGTILINVLGSFLIGFIIPFIANNQKLYYLCIIGFLGGFTTFSSFSLEFINYLINKEYILANIYLVSSILLSIISTTLGLYFAKIIIL